MLKRFFRRKTPAAYNIHFKDGKFIDGSTGSPLTFRCWGDGAIAIGGVTFSPEAIKMLKP